MVLGVLGVLNAPRSRDVFRDVFRDDWDDPGDIAIDGLTTINHY